MIKFILCLLLTAPAFAKSADFRILMDGTDVGHHRVSVTQEGDKTIAITDISIVVYLAGLVPVYRYQHNSREVWQNGQLTSLNSKTDDDGKDQFINLTLNDTTYIIETHNGTQNYPASLIPTSYWNQDLIKQTTLLDSQKGRLLAINFTPQPDGWHNMQGDLDLRIKYCDKTWCGMEFTLKDRVFTYLAR